ncbi:hypothetical protein OSTOST_23568 [Ostertagia ostertagi]
MSINDPQMAVNSRSEQKGEAQEVKETRNPKKNALQQTQEALLRKRSSIAANVEPLEAKEIPEKKLESVVKREGTAVAGKEERKDDEKDQIIAQPKLENQRLEELARYRNSKGKIDLFLEFKRRNQKVPGIGETAREKLRSIGCNNTSDLFAVYFMSESEEEFTKWLKKIADIKCQQCETGIRLVHWGEL